ncbi:MAG: FG-GAP repeat domain-containing protein [Terriglobales bacterium]
MEPEGTTQRKQHCRTLFRFFLFVTCLGCLLSPVAAQTFLYNQTSLPTGNVPEGIAVADFNGDGRLDVAVANTGDNTVSVILSTPGGGFAPKVDYKVGSQPVAVVSADFNGDKIPDLAVVNSGDNTVSILLGAGSGTFSSQVTYATGNQPWGLVALDLNSDNKVDLAILNLHDATVSVFLGNGDGTFASQITTAFPFGPATILSGDINGDGLPDLILPGNGGLEVLLNTGNAQFSVSFVSAGVEGISGSAIGDFNGDGRLDVALIDPLSENAVVMLGDDTGGFVTRTTSIYNVPLNTVLAVGDFNNDGKLDLAVGTSTYPSSILILLGLGDGTFQPQLNSGFPYVSAIVAADFNNDGYLDIVASDEFRNVVTIMLGNGKGHIGGSVDFSLPLSAGVGGAAAADFNGDGKLDVAVVQGQATQGRTSISVLPGNGDGTFQQPITTPAANIGTQLMVAADFRGDGNTDIATSFPNFGVGLSVLLGDGDGTFGVPVANPLNLSAPVIGTMVAGDFNNDGKQDLAFLSDSVYSDALYVGLSNGDGTFQPMLVGTFTSATALASADFNHDGNLDIAVAQSEAGGTPSAIVVFLGKGDGTFSGPTSYNTGNASTYGVSAADFNGDGKVDLVVATDQGIAFLAGNGDGTFQAPIQSSNLIALGTAVAGDFNADGKPDLLLGPVSAGGYGESIALGNGDGTFQNEITFQPTNYGDLTGFAVGDFNADGVLDLAQFSTVLNTTDQAVSVWTSAPAIIFSTPDLSFTSQNVGASTSPASILLTNADLQDRNRRTL